MSSTFSLFKQFPELKVHVFGKEDACKSDEECIHKLGFTNLSKLKQIHSDITHVVHEVPEKILEGDGLVTNKSGLALSVRFADCQAFAIYAPKKHIVGVVHAGWRGVADRALTSFFATLKNHFDVSPQDTFVGEAPSICAKCATFSDPESELPPHMHAFIDGKHVDLIAAAEKELDIVGVPQNQRERLDGCTKCGEGYWSCRGGDGEMRNYVVVGIVT